VTTIYLTAAQVAERLQVSVSWVYKHKHLLGAVQVGERMWRFPEQQLHAHLAVRPQLPGQPARGASEEGATTRRWRLTY
jgi:excisionase family DNA binding protein